MSPDSWQGGVAVVSGSEVMYVAPGADPRKLASLPAVQVHAMAGNGETLYLATDDGLLRVANGHAVPERGPNDLLGGNRALYAVAVSEDGAIAVGGERARHNTLTEGDALHSDGQRQKRAPAGCGVRSTEGRLWFGTPQGAAVRRRVDLYTGQDGLHTRFCEWQCGRRERVVATRRKAQLA